jgi:hypothetical protein
MKNPLFSHALAAILCFGFSVTTASAQENALKLYGKAHPFTIEQLPEGELKTKLQQISASAREEAMKRLHKISFHSFDAAKHLRVDNGGGIYTVCSGGKNCAQSGCADSSHNHGAATPEVQESALKDLTKVPEASSTWNSPLPRVAKAPVPIASPPAYNSRPTATHHIYLDFNGGIVTGKAWNTNVASYDCLPWSSDNDQATFNDAEQTVMFQVWQRMSEDFAPFNVNITTDPRYDPASANPYPGLNRNNIGWIMHTPTKDRNNKDCPHAGAGGVAYVDVFGASDYFSQYQPAWTAIQAGQADDFAEVSSHEIGHNFGLSHDGRGTDEYYGGHGTGPLSWGPIMGASYGQNMTQWSRGDYSASTQGEDDLSIIANKLGGISGYRIDDHADTIGSATPLTITGSTQIFSTNPETDPTNADPVNKGVIERSTDIDVFSFETGDGDVTIAVDTWMTSSGTYGNNLDISLELQDSSGQRVELSTPGTIPNAGITRNLTAGTYYLIIRNSSAGTPMNLDPTGYSAYGSLGQYFISGTIIEPTPRLRVLSITPDEAENDADVDVVITGRLFDADTEVFLNRGTETIQGTINTIVSADELNVTFPITGATIGEWDLFAQNLVTTETDTLSDAFNITLPVIDFFEEDFDGFASFPSGGWTTYSTTGELLLWGLDDAYQSPAQSLSAETPSYPATKYVQSPPITVPAAAINLELCFWQSCDLEDGYDGGVMEFSVDGGETWFDVTANDSGAHFESNGYNQIISDEYRSPIAGRYAWSGDSKGFVQTVISLSNAPKYAGKELIIRWLLATDSSAASSSWKIDTVELKGSIDPDYNAVPVNELEVAGADGLEFTGYYGGPFTPTPQVYTLTNTGTTQIKWNAYKTSSWVTLSSTSGSLLPGASTTVSVSINSNSLSLPIGNITDTITFHNQSKPDLDILREVALDINRIPATLTITRLLHTYNGSPKKVTVTTDPIGLAVKVTYNGSKTAPTDAGIYTVVARINNSTNYTGSSTSTMEIRKAATTVTTWPTAASIPVGQTVASATLSGGSASVPGTFSYVSPATVYAVGTYAVPVVFTPTNANYADVSGTVNVTVYPVADLVRTTVNNVSNSSWTVVNLGKTYVSPVIVATPIYTSSTLPPVVTRIRKVTPTSFELKLARADGLTTAVSMNVSVIAVNEGVYTLSQHGVKMEAVKYRSTLTASGTTAWNAEARTYRNAYTRPVVVGQVMSNVDSKWSVFWSRGSLATSPISSTSLNVGKHVGLDPVKTRGNETIGYIVIESGTGTIEGARYQAAVGSDIVRGFGDSVTPYTYALSGFTSVSAAAVSQTGMDGTEGSWAVMSGSPALTTTALKLHVAEDGLNNTLRSHTTEQVAFIVFQ